MDQVLLKKNGKTICWKRLGLDDVDELERLMIEYCRSEPLHAALSSPKLEETEVAKARKMLAENLTFGAYDLDDKEHLCAFMLNGEYDLATQLPQDMEKAKKNFSTEYSKIFRFCYDAIKDLEDVVHDQKFIYESDTCTTASYRNMGITTQLQKKLEELCKERKRRYIVGVYTSPYSQRSSKTLGYKPIKEIQIADYHDPLTNDKPFKDVKVPPTGIGMYFDTEQ